jgi:hypothetical protein
MKTVFADTGYWIALLAEESPARTVMIYHAMSLSLSYRAVHSAVPLSTPV